MVLAATLRVCATAPCLSLSNGLASAAASGASGQAIPRPMLLRHGVEAAMSVSPGMRRSDLAMSEQRLIETLERGYCGRLATVGADGFPYCVPLLYVWADGLVFLHTARARGHLRANLDHEPRVCFVVDEPGEVYPYGRFECDTTLAYRSVTLFGSIGLVDDAAGKRQFFARLMAKYARPDWGRPRDFLPRIDAIDLYAIAPERMTGKEIPLPAMAQRWPELDRTKSPNARVDPAGEC
jgi:uncharacterized protein